jgi:hypothetical protein
VGILVRQWAVWRDSNPHVRQGGVWRPGDKGFVRQGGVWREVYSSLALEAGFTSTFSKFGGWSGWVSFSGYETKNLNVSVPAVSINNGSGGINGSARMEVWIHVEHSAGTVGGQYDYSEMSADRTVNPPNVAATTCAATYENYVWNSFCGVASATINVGQSAVFSAVIKRYFNDGSGGNIRWRCEGRVRTTEPYPYWG